MDIAPTTGQCMAYNALLVPFICPHTGLQEQHPWSAVFQLYVICMNHHLESYFMININFARFSLSFFLLQAIIALLVDSVTSKRSFLVACHPYGASLVGSSPQMQGLMWPHELDVLSG